MDDLIEEVLLNFRLLSLFNFLEGGVILLLGTVLLFPGKLFPLSWHPYLILSLLLFSSIGIPFAYLQRHVNHSKSVDEDQLGNICSKHHHALFHSPLTSLIILLLCMMAIGFWVSSEKARSLTIVGYSIFGIVLYSALLRWPSKIETIKKITWLLLACGVGLISITPFILLWRADSRIFDTALTIPLQQLQLSVGETIHPNIMAGGIVVILPVAISIVFFEKKRLSPFPFTFYLMVVMGMTIVLFLTQSRGALLALSVVFVLSFTFYQPRFVLIILTGCVILVVIYSYLAYPQFSYYMQTVFNALPGIEGRLEIWQTSLTAIADFPFTGIGIGIFTTVIPLLYPLSFPIESYPHAHNLFLQIALDLGLPGLIAYLALLINLIAMLIVTLRKAPRHTMIHTLAIGAAGSLVGMLTHGLLDAVTWGTKLSFLPWILFALITQLFLHVQEDELASAKEGNSNLA